MTFDLGLMTRFRCCSLCQREPRPVKRPMRNRAFSAQEDNRYYEIRLLEVRSLGRATDDALYRFTHPVATVFRQESFPSSRIYLGR